MKKQTVIWLAVLSVPFVVLLLGFLVAFLVGPSGLGCSEYEQFKSTKCSDIEYRLGINLHWVAMKTIFLTLPFVAVSIITTLVCVIIMIFRRIKI